MIIKNWLFRWLEEISLVRSCCKHFSWFHGDLGKCEIIESSTWSYIIDSFGLITIEETLHELSYKNNYEYIFGSTREEVEKALYKIKFSF